MSKRKAIINRKKSHKRQMGKHDKREYPPEKEKKTNFSSNS